MYIGNSAKFAKCCGCAKGLYFNPKPHIIFGKQFVKPKTVCIREQCKMRKFS